MESEKGRVAQAVSCSRMWLSVLGQAEEGGVMPTTAKDLIDERIHPHFRGWPPETAVLVLASRVEKILALHRASSIGVCYGCEFDWPCPTVRILNGEE